MRNRLIALSEKLRASYWFIPMIMGVLAILLSIITIELDEGIGREIRWITGLIYVDSPEGARAVLSTVASSMISVAGTVFSLTMVVLSLTSQQYGPLVLAHFMRDRGNQFVLGIFTATFIYCLLILRTIRGVENSFFIPHISVLVGLGMSLISLAVLIYFIHHVSQSIQAPNIITRINHELVDAVDELFPVQIGQELSPVMDEDLQSDIIERFSQAGFSVKTSKSGYLQMVDADALIDIANQHNLIISLDVLPGRFLFKGQTLVQVLPKTASEEALKKSIEEVFIIGSTRTRTQDIEFTITQLSALAVRALSPGINDPFTAIMVIDHLGEALCAVVARQQPSIFRYDENKELRVVARAINFKALFHAAFDQISHYGYTDLLIAVRLLQVFKALWEFATTQSDRTFLENNVKHLYEESRVKLRSSENDRLYQTYTDIMKDFQST